MTVTAFVLVGLQLATMLAAALGLGIVMRRIKQPVVLGEMIGGILVGPTVFGAIAPQVYEWLFDSSADATMIRDSAVKLGMLFFLYIAGSEIDLTDLKRTGKQALSIGLIGTLVPIAVGVGLVFALPASFWGDAATAHLLGFALFIGMNLANSANPVLARILMDIGLLRSPLGTLSMSATIVDDLINWALFAVILGTMMGGAAASTSAGDVAMDVVLVLILFALTLGLLRRVFPRWIPALRRRLPWPSGFIGFVALLILGVATLAEGIGVHAFLGAFLVGAALGSHDKEQEEANTIVANFSLSFFAPIYFVSMGMTTDFITNFDFALVAVITVVAFTSKLGAVLLGAAATKMPIDRNTWAIGFGLNARGATGIILAGVGLQAGVIDSRVFVAIVVMALITSFVAGPAMNYLLRPDQIHATGPSVADEDLTPAIRRLPLIRRVLIPVRPGRVDHLNLGGAVELRLLDSLGPKLDVTLLAVGTEDEAESTERFLTAVGSLYPNRSIRTRAVIDSDPSRAIVAEAASHDLVIVGGPEDMDGAPILQPPAYGEPARGPLLSPVIWEVLTEVQCPTMVVWRHLMRPDPQRILVPGDNTVRTEVAADLAFALAEGTGAAVTMLQVIQSAGYAQSFDDAAAVAERAMQLRRPGVSFETQVVRSTDPADTISRVAGDLKADLLILSTRTRPGHDTRIVGETARAILEDPPCPIALVHVPEG